MESNKSKGVEELLKQMAWAAWQSAANAYRMYPDNKHTFTDYWHDLGKAEAENLIAAHPQQSEATSTDHATSIGTPIQTTAAASEGVEDEIEKEFAKYYGRTREAQSAYDEGRKDEEGVIVNFIKEWNGERNSELGDLLYDKMVSTKSKAEGVGQAAEGQSPEDYNEAWMDVINIIETDNCHALVGYDETLAKLKAKGYRLVSQPSEPAALKEFYCIGDKDNLFQCEEQCEDCKKGAALKDGEVLTVGLFYDKRNLRWTTAEATKCDESGKPTSWAVRNGGFCMSRSSGEFEWEPQPSSRSDEWLADHRFDTLEAALKEFASLLTNHKS